MKTVIIIFLSTIMFSTQSLADEYAVIANQKMKDLSRAQIKAIFLKKITVIEDINAVPVNLGARDPIREKLKIK
ncbi:hypothetical protein [Sulfurimonas sp.]|uniref:hypothetical protein n=1 Tax=Sulfurimonas sp. TaxID=2022749 RepID=UPI0025F10E28|nr:hypothetical protein [Sulfurimonas sp.]MBW6488099.1 hypothetical protein [Sulfurimonas sp.]